MLFVLIAVAIAYYLVGFGGGDEYEFTNRTNQELRTLPGQRTKSSPTRCWSGWKPLEGQKGPRARTPFVATLKGEANDDAVGRPTRATITDDRRPGAHQPAC